MSNAKGRVKRTLIRIAAVLGAALIALAAVSAGALAVLQARTDRIREDTSGIFGDGKYRAPVYVEGVEVITQEISCGYAVIEMFSAWDGGSVTEQQLYDEYGRVVTSTGGAFRDEMNKRIPGYNTTMRKYLTDTELIDAVYDSLSAGVPVPVEWAALYGDEWTLHYSLIIGMDIPGDRVTVANPYGYTEEITVGELLDRTSFEAYGDMPLFLRLAFAFGIFEKNTVFLPQPVK